MVVTEAFFSTRQVAKLGFSSLLNRPIDQAYKYFPGVETTKITILFHERGSQTFAFFHFHFMS